MTVTSKCQCQCRTLLCTQIACTAARYADAKLDAAGRPEGKAAFASKDGHLGEIIIKVSQCGKGQALDHAHDDGSKSEQLWIHATLTCFAGSGRPCSGTAALGE